MKELDWLNGIDINQFKLGLDNITFLMNKLGNPQNDFKTIHVAGSDGKGSTSAMIHSILTNNGYRTGLYTSPHVVRFNERIRIGDDEITDDELEHYIGIVRPIIEDMKKRDMECTYFEITTAVAFRYFREKRIDYAVVEVGLGGRFDATNVIVPEVSVITNISLEHQKVLGNTIDKIAYEKSGIIKSYIPTVTCNDGVALDVIRNRCKEKNSKLIVTEEPIIKELSAKGTSMSYKGNDYDINLLGSYQAVNASMAIEVAKILSLKNVEKALRNVRWPYRLQTVEDKIIVDVTHTKAGSEVMCQTVKEVFGNVTVVFGVLSDKDISGIAENLAKITDTVFLYQPETKRAMPSEMMEHMMKGIVKNIVVCGRFDDAMKKAQATGKTVLITGSFYMAEAFEKWESTRDL